MVRRDSLVEPVEVLGLLGVQAGLYLLARWGDKTVGAVYGVPLGSSAVFLAVLPAAMILGKVVIPRLRIDPPWSLQIVVSSWPWEMGLYAAARWAESGSAMLGMPPGLALTVAAMLVGTLRAITVLLVVLGRRPRLRWLLAGLFALGAASAAAVIAGASPIWPLAAAAAAALGLLGAGLISQLGSVPQERVGCRDVPLAALEGVGFAICVMVPLNFSFTDLMLMQWGTPAAIIVTILTVGVAAVWLRAVMRPDNDAPMGVHR